MERTEELHQIHSQLNFGKLKVLMAKSPCSCTFTYLYLPLAISLGVYFKTIGAKGINDDAGNRAKIIRQTEDSKTSSIRFCVHWLYIDHKKKEKVSHIQTYHLSQVKVTILLFTIFKISPKGEISYKVLDYASKAVVEIEKLKLSKASSYPKHTFGEHETVARATWLASSANEPHSFLLMLLDNSVQKVEKYVLVCQNEWVAAVIHVQNMWFLVILFL